MSKEAWENKIKAIAESVSYDDAENCFWVGAPLHFTKKDNAEAFKEHVLDFLSKKRAEDGMRRIMFHDWNGIFSVLCPEESASSENLYKEYMARERCGFAGLALNIFPYNRQHFMRWLQEEKKCKIYVEML